MGLLKKGLRGLGYAIGWLQIAFYGAVTCGAVIAFGYVFVRQLGH